jgi:hypothetical protein
VRQLLQAHAKPKLLRALRTLSVSFSGVLFATTGARAQEVTPYVSSPRIEAKSLTESQQKTLQHFFSLSLKGQTEKQLSSEVCKAKVERSFSPTPTAHVAQALVESDLATEITFAKGDQSISYTLEFTQDRVLIYSSAARYESERNGLLVAYPPYSSTTHYFESKGQGGVAFIIPPVSECGTKFVLACPRVYNQSRQLIESQFEPKEVRFFPAMKADGLLKAPDDGPGKVRGSALSTERVILPSTWFREETSSPSPSVTFRLYRQTNYFLTSGARTSITLPFKDALEAHLEFGTPGNMLREARSRNTIEVSSLPLKNTETTRVENSEISLQPGACFLITSVKESHYT